ncbi:MAG: threonine ammonia-lyase [Geminicoccaceae bacterium]
MHNTGTFKIRGAANKLLSLSDAERRRGVITVSSGNHGKSVAYMAEQLGSRAVICVSHLVPPEKVAGLRAYGAEVVTYGQNQDEADAKARELVERDGLVFVPPFDDPFVIAGQGTLGLELVEQCPQLETILVQLSGGGLMSGVALALKALRPQVRLIAVSSLHGAAMHESVKAGHIIKVDEKISIADALPGPIPSDNVYTFDLCRRLVDDFVKVSDAAIEQAMAYILRHEKCVVEGGAAAGVAHLLAQAGSIAGNAVVAILTGDNIAVDRALRVYSKGP